MSPDVPLAELILSTKVNFRAFLKMEAKRKSKFQMVGHPVCKIYFLPPTTE